MRPDRATPVSWPRCSRATAPAPASCCGQYDVDNVVDNGEQVAVQLRWTATTAVDAGALPAGTELDAHVAIFYAFRDGKILRQSSYDCYEPIKAAS